MMYGPKADAATWKTCLRVEGREKELCVEQANRAWNLKKTVFPIHGL